MALTREQVTAIRRAQRPASDGPEGFTSSEFAAAIGQSFKTATMKLNRLIDEGVVEYAGRALRPARDQSLRSVQVYRLVKR